MQSHCSLMIADASQVGAARRSAATLISLLGLNETDQGRIALIVTEIANNILLHAGRGEMLLRAIESDGVIGVEILGLDKGPGMASVSQSMRDGYSTAGTPGNGMGAIGRLSSRFEVYSHPGVGAVLLSQLWSKPPPFCPPAEPIDSGAVIRPKPGQDVCGDSYAVAHHPGKSLFLVADGLGHGPDAAAASRAAVRAFHAHSLQSPTEILEAIHGALSGTRGAAASVAEIDIVKQEVRFAGIGNVAGTVVRPAGSHSMVAYNGILGHQVRKFQAFPYAWSPDALLVMHSDGLAGQWQLDRYPGLSGRRAGLIAGVLYRDFQRDTDDTTVLVGSAPRGTG